MQKIIECRNISNERTIAGFTRRVNGRKKKNYRNGSDDEIQRRQLNYFIGNNFKKHL